MSPARPGRQPAKKKSAYQPPPNSRAAAAARGTAASSGRAKPTRSRSSQRDAPPSRAWAGKDDGLGGDQIEGRRAVLELLRAGSRPIQRVLVASGQDPAQALDDIEAMAQAQRIPLELVSKGRLESIARTDTHQGVLALARAVQPVELDELIEGHPGVAPFLLVAAGITDPRNLGALLRSAECAGVTGVVLPRHRTARLSPSVAKTAAGAIEHLPFATVPGIPAGLERLSKAGVLTIGLAGEAKRSIFDLDLSSVPVALVLGEEEKGLAPLVRKRCDELVAIPQFGDVESLNVSVAGAVAFYEVARQRLAASR